MYDVARTPFLHTTVLLFAGGGIRWSQELTGVVAMLLCLRSAMCPLRLLHVYAQSRKALCRLFLLHLPICLSPITGCCPRAIGVYVELCVSCVCCMSMRGLGMLCVGAKYITRVWSWFDQLICIFSSRRFQQYMRIF